VTNSVDTRGSWWSDGVVELKKERVTEVGGKDRIFGVEFSVQRQKGRRGGEQRELGVE